MRFFFLVSWLIISMCTLSIAETTELNPRVETTFIIIGSGSMNGAKISETELDPRTNISLDLYSFQKYFGIGLGMDYNSSKTTYNNFIRSNDSLKLETSNLVLSIKAALRYPFKIASPYIAAGFVYGKGYYSEDYSSSVSSTYYPADGNGSGGIFEIGVLLTPIKQLTVNFFYKSLDIKYDMKFTNTDEKIKIDMGGDVAGVGVGLVF